MTWTASTLDVAIAAIARATQTTAEPAPRSPLPYTTLTHAQEDAILLARSALQRYGGILIADPPGSGKSFIGLQLALEADRSAPPVLITAPAALVPTWKHLCRAAGLHASFLSHTRLSLDDRTVETTPAPRFILVDEAHAFRSPHTRRYRTLARLCRHARVLLLTATPVNNSLLDLYFQLRLFLADDAFAHLGITHLGATFRAAADLSPSAPLPPPLASALRHVLIRRSRAAASPRQAADTAARYPHLRPPTLLTYDLDDVRPGFTRSALHTLGELSLAAFAHGSSTRPAAELIRLTLAKRLESSLAAFAASLHSLAHFHQAFLDALDSGHLLRPRDLPPTSDPSVQLVFAPVLGEPVPRALDRTTLHRLVTRDLDQLRQLLRLTRELQHHDPKRHRLLRHLQGPLRGRRVLLFTEFRETAADLWSALRHVPGAARLDGSGAWIASGRIGRAELIRRFAPTANNAPPPPPHEAIHLVVATDVLSEGINLQDADTLISFDLPWNPVRLIQRIGRIDRLGSPHSSVEAFIFMPDRWLDEFIALVDRVDAKLATIHRVLAGEPPPTHAADRHAAFVRALVSGLAPDAATTAPGNDAEDPSDLDPLRAILGRPRFTGVLDLPALAAGAIPVAIAHCPPLRRRTTLLALDSGRGVVLLDCRRHSARPASPRLIRLLLHVIPTSEPRLGTSLLRHLDHTHATALAHAHPRLARQSSDVARRAVRRALRLAAASPDLAPTADALVLQLARDLRAGDVFALREWLRIPVDPADPAAAAHLLHGLRCLLDRPHASDAPTDPRPVPIAAVILLPATPKSAHRKKGEVPLRAAPRPGT